jgi:hypothetical protein
MTVTYWGYDPSTHIDIWKEGYIGIAQSLEYRERQHRVDSDWCGPGIEFVTIYRGELEHCKWLERIHSSLTRFRLPSIKFWVKRIKRVDKELGETEITARGAEAKQQMIRAMYLLYYLEKGFYWVRRRWASLNRIRMECDPEMLPPPGTYYGRLNLPQSPYLAMLAGLIPSKIRPPTLPFTCLTI